MDWSGLGGRFRRFPVGVYKVGEIAARAEAIEVPDLQEDPTWLADPAWARREGIRGFAGQPLLHRGQVLGVLGVFLRARLDGELLIWLRMIADHAAVAIVNARISDRSRPRYRRFRWALRRMLAQVNLFLAQTEEDSARLQAIGADPARVRVTGNLKFDVNVPAASPIVESLRRAFANS